MQRLGFPTRVNIGKGSPVNYTWRKLILLALALQYPEVGSTPYRSVAETVKFEGPVLIRLVDVIMANDRDNNMMHLNCFLCAELTSLSTLKVESEWHQKVEMLSGQDLHQTLSLEVNNAYRSPYKIIDLRQFVGGLVKSVIDICGLDNSIVATDVKLWAKRQRLAGYELDN